MAEGVAEARVKIAGQDVATDALGQVVIEQDVDQPDMCCVTVNNTSEYKYSEKVKQADEVEVTIGPTTDQPKALFLGEVVGLEPVFDVGGESKILVRAFNKLHRLTRAKKSRTFQDMTDNDIVQKIAGEYGLTAEMSGSVHLKYKHVYQNDISDLEFLHKRARRINYELFVRDRDKLVWRERDLADDSGIELKWGKDAGGAEFSLQIFRPRLSTASQVKEVYVRGWDSLKSQTIVGEAKSLKTKMGSVGGADAAKDFGEAKATYEMALYSKEEADAAAKSLLEDHGLSFIVGEGQCKGHPQIKAGKVVSIKCEDKRFDGKYYLTGVSHRYSHKQGGPQGGYLTMIRFRRNAADA